MGIGYSASLAAYEMLFPLSQVVEVMPSVLEAIPEERSNIENIAALGISGTSILAKEFLFRYTLYVRRVVLVFLVCFSSHRRRV